MPPGRELELEAALRGHWVSEWPDIGEHLRLVEAPEEHPRDLVMLGHRLREVPRPDIEIPPPACGHAGDLAQVLWELEERWGDPAFTYTCSITRELLAWRADHLPASERGAVWLELSDALAGSRSKTLAGGLAVALAANAPDRVVFYRAMWPFWEQHPHSGDPAASVSVSPQRRSGAGREDQSAGSGPPPEGLLRQEERS